MQAFPGTEDTRTVEDIDRHIKRANMSQNDERAELRKLVNAFARVCAYGDDINARIVGAQKIYDFFDAALANQRAEVPQGWGLQFSDERDFCRVSSVLIGAAYVNGSDACSAINGMPGSRTFGRVIASASPPPPQAEQQELPTNQMVSEFENAYNKKLRRQLEQEWMELRALRAAEQPAAQALKPLTDEQIMEAVSAAGLLCIAPDFQVARAAIAKFCRINGLPQQGEG